MRKTRETARAGERSALLRYTRRPSTVRGGNRVTLLKDGTEAIPDILASIDAAGESVHIEAYILRDDSVGWRLAEALHRAARRGVTVRLTYDSAGCINTDIALFDSLERYGVEVLEYRPIAPWRPRWSWNNRNHRKLVVVDGVTAYCMGLNWGEEYTAQDDGTPGWRDAAVRVDGPAARDVHLHLIRTWRRYKDRTIDIGRTLAVPRARGGTLVEVIATHRRRTRGSIRRAYLHAIKRAHATIYIANAYFVPDPGVVRALANAVRRNVDVRVIVPGTNDVAAVYFATRAVFERLLSSGVRMYEWSGAMMHAKTCVIDSVWSTVGSANLDPRSRIHNQEANVMVFDGRFGRQMHRAFLLDLQSSTEVRLSTWERRGFWHRLIERLVYYFQYWL